MMELAVSMMIIYKKELRDLSQTINDNVDIKNWEVVDEGFHRLDRWKIRELKEIASTREVRYAVHAPFSSINLAESDSRLRNMFVRFMKKSLKRAHELEAKTWVLHSGRFTPFTYFCPEKAWEAHARSLLELSKEARDLGIRIAVENMPGRYELFNSVENGRRLLEDVQSEYVGFCFDIGHANLLGGVDRFLIGFPNEIFHIHVHDNNGEGDSHVALGQGNINWRNFFSLLKEVGYDRWIVFENYELSDVKEGIDFFPGLGG